MTLTPKTIPLDAMHRAAGATMVPFAGFSMPLQYPAGIMAEHLHTRAQASLFDVSHMGQARLVGQKQAVCAALEKLLVSDIGALPVNRMRYTVLMNAAGGVVDDLMITHLPQEYYLVVNAACIEKDFTHIRAHLPADVTLEAYPHKALLALQGVAAEAVLEELGTAVASQPFMGAFFADIAGVSCFITRSGYTGEDGFEISCDGAQAAIVAEALLRNPAVAWAGLGARDTLRLEAGLCLYGHELNEQISPLEAGLAWVVDKAKVAAGGVLGAARLQQELAGGKRRQRLALQHDSKAPLRAGAEVLHDDGTVNGVITSGGFSPTLQCGIALALVDDASAPLHTVRQRGRDSVMRKVKPPFVAHRYKK